MHASEKPGRQSALTPALRLRLPPPHGASSAQCRTRGSRFCRSDPYRTPASLSRARSLTVAHPSRQAHGGSRPGSGCRPCCGPSGSASRTLCCAWCAARRRAGPAPRAQPGRSFGPADAAPQGPHPNEATLVQHDRHTRSQMQGVLSAVLLPSPHGASSAQCRTRGSRLDHCDPCRTPASLSRARSLTVAHPSRQAHGGSRPGSGCRPCCGPSGSASRTLCCAWCAARRRAGPAPRAQPGRSFGPADAAPQGPHPNEATLVQHDRHTRSQMQGVLSAVLLPSPHGASSAQCRTRGSRFCRCGPCRRPASPSRAPSLSAARPSRRAHAGSRPG